MGQRRERPPAPAIALEPDQQGDDDQHGWLLGMDRVHPRSDGDRLA